MSAPAQPYTLHDLRKEDFYEKLIAHPAVEAVYVYGSYSTGRAHAHSDVDLAVDCPEATKEQWEEIQNIVKNSLCLLPLDVTRIDTLKPGPFRDYLMKHRSLLYLRDPVDHLQMAKEKLEKVVVEKVKLHKTLATETAVMTPEHIKLTLKHFYNYFRLLVRVLRRANIIAGVRTAGRIQALRQALIFGYIEDRRLWELIYRDWEIAQRNPTIPIAREIIERLRSYVVHMDKAIETLDSLCKRETALAQEIGITPIIRASHA